VRLTDLFVTDRARPDRAIDALDEACAHAQATATYSPETERLILERRRLVREVEQERLSRAERVESRRTERQTGVPTGNVEDEPEMDDPLDKLARDGIAALERFGAELEAAFSGARVPTAPADATRTTTRTEMPAPAPPRETTVASRLAALETDLQRRLMEEGIVVRGHDVARVVSVATGRSVQWTES
jgi:ATP-dependent Clp protease ATP-binding subunit ClpA